MIPYQTECNVVKSDKLISLIFRKRNVDFQLYFKDFFDRDAVDSIVALRLMENTMKESGRLYDVKEIKVGKNIQIDMGPDEEDYIEDFIRIFLDELEEFYEKNEIHITRMFGSFIYLKRISGKLKAIHATPIPIQHCPLMKKLLMEIGGKMASELLLSLDQTDKEFQTQKMCELINKVVIDGGYFDTSRPLNSCEANVLFGASETMSSAFKNGLIDAAVIVSNNLGTIITTNETNTQGAVKRMTGLLLTSPSKELLETAQESGIIPVFPHTAVIDQLEGVKLAISKGYKKIAVSVAWHDNDMIHKIKELATEDVSIYIFALCSTGVESETAQKMLQADIVWSCASKAVKEYIEPNAIAQVGIKIPVHVMTLKGWELVKNHLREMSILDHPSEETFDSIQPCMGSGKPVVLHADEGFKVIKKEELRKCCDCPNPCI